MCASAIIRNTAPAAVTTIAPAAIRRAVSTSSTGPKPRRFSHITVAPPAAAIVNSHESSRTLSQPGDSTSTARIWRMTMSA